ncbi:hypothetical protein, partial [Haematobacter massiliensis]
RGWEIRVIDELREDIAALEHAEATQDGADVLRSLGAMHRLDKNRRLLAKELLRLEDCLEEVRTILKEGSLPEQDRLDRIYSVVKAARFIPVIRNEIDWCGCDDD